MKTLLVNSTKKEYMELGAEYPINTHKYLLSLEKASNWNLSNDDIYVAFTDTTYGYKQVKDKAYINKTGGEIIKETFTMYDLKDKCFQNHK